MTIRRHLRNFISFYLGTPFKINSNNEVETKLTKTIDGIQILSIYLPICFLFALVCSKTHSSNKLIFVYIYIYIGYTSLNIDLSVQFNCSYK